MHHTQPLRDHPELKIIEHPNCREYRVENWRFARDGSRRVLKFYGWSWMDALIPIIIAYMWPAIVANRIPRIAILLLVAAYVFTRCTQLLWESVITIPNLGIQLETHRGLPSLPLFTSRHFIPLAFLHDFIINEGLRGWNVRYYLAALTKSQTGKLSLHVAYENILPYFPVLLEVYNGVHQDMFPVSDRDTNSDVSDTT
ncbi:hypothetical protein NLI96_g9956 [Meripilus lineatus]|uniref:Phosphatidylinositol N-acetylglucosaminyltransferase subunit H conserved domain-containing protein n=1 Tax=Meripilus lineatus TaxID=2056292 RepID=A0AAD5Y9Q4_9APHY|nr:hypothetical protein NLI96_g9956 [Physisporinus lineatus]